MIANINTIMNILALYFDKKAPNLVNFYASRQSGFFKYIFSIFHFYLHNCKYCSYEYFILSDPCNFLVSSFSTFIWRAAYVDTLALNHSCY